MKSLMILALATVLISGLLALASPAQGVDGGYGGYYVTSNDWSPQRLHKRFIPLGLQGNEQDPAAFGSGGYGESKIDNNVMATVESPKRLQKRFLPLGLQGNEQDPWGFGGYGETKANNVVANAESPKRLQKRFILFGLQGNEQGPWGFGGYGETKANNVVANAESPKRLQKRFIFYRR